MARRSRVDLELARLISDRLALVLAEQPPRRARGPGPADAEESEFPSESALDSAGDGRAHVVAEALEELPRATMSTPVQSAPTASASTSERATRLVVHVLGAVRRPGLVKLPESSRVQDAIDAAGGLTDRADPGELNLAQLIADGQQLVIGTTSDPAGEVRDGRESGSGGGSAGTATLDLNRASQAELEELPGVGPVTAGAILSWRQQHGRFSRIEELQEVDGIGPKTYAQIAPHVRV